MKTLLNSNSITETTVHSTYKEITEYEIEVNISNIGKPIPTLSTYIVDKNMNLLPIGVSGELCVGGEGVARGYLNRPELTDKKFVINPHIFGERLYRSGDLAKVLPNGEMEYLGRIDHQVKIRGFRVELGEIESKLLNHPNIKSAIVLARKNENEEKYLCAYVLADIKLVVEDIRTYLGKDLPDYMIPSYFIQIDKIPLTNNGKVNKKALPEPDGVINTGVEYVAPENEIEKKLVEIWQDILTVKTIGIDDIPVLNLATDYPRPALQSFEGERISFAVSTKLTNAINSLAAQTDTTLYMVLLAAYNSLLYKYTGQEDMVVGSPVAGRAHDDLKGIIGIFVNTVALRNYPEGNKRFSDFLSEVKENSLLAFENQDYQFEELVEKLDIRRDMSRNPLFDTMLVLQNMDMTEIELSKIKFKTHNFKNKIAKFDLTLTATESEEGLLFEIEYCTKLFKEETIQRFKNYFINILTEIGNDSEIRLDELDILSDQEKV
ncbi:MAG: AMP-binding protein [Halanaerobiales bacterium]|nr:AMP-binding protein [Halanaerobiales bacterium]